MKGVLPHLCRKLRKYAQTTIAPLNPDATAVRTEVTNTSEAHDLTSSQAKHIQRTQRPRGSLPRGLCGARVVAQRFRAAIFAVFFDVFESVV